ncbi:MULTISPECIES: ABC-three component system protein [Oscillospiraceae]
MVDWLQDATHENRSSCKVIISYFIQKYEVFDAITE